MLLANVSLLHIDAVDKPSALAIPVRTEHDVIPAHHPLAHLARLPIKSPVLEAIAPLPAHAVIRILILVPELDCNAVVGEGKELLAEAVVALAGPFGGQKGNDGVGAGEEVVAVAPDAVNGVGLRDSRRISSPCSEHGTARVDYRSRYSALLGVPRVLGRLDLLPGGVLGEGGFDICHCTG